MKGIKEPEMIEFSKGLVLGEKEEDQDELVEKLKLERNLPNSDCELMKFRILRKRKEEHQ